MATARARRAHVPYFLYLLAAAPVQSRDCALGECGSCGRRGVLEGAAALPEMLRTPYCAGAGLREFAYGPNWASTLVRLLFRGAPPGRGQNLKFVSKIAMAQHSFRSDKSSDMRTVLHAIVAAALFLLSGSSAPPLPCAARRGAPPGAFFYGTIALGRQASASSSPRRFQTRSLRRPPLGPPPHRRPPERRSSEGLHRPSRASFPAPSSPSRFPASQVRLRSLCARACMAGSGAGRTSKIFVRGA
jgi:hypothetical protein